MVEDHSAHCDEENEALVEWFWHHFSFWKWRAQQQEKWRDFDVRAAQAITDFKDQKILSIGDMRVRSSLMFVTTGATYLLLTIHRPSTFVRMRNFAASFALNGYLWVPELFNPMLIRKPVPLIDPPMQVVPPPVVEPPLKVVLPVVVELPPQVVPAPVIPSN